MQLERTHDCLLIEGSGGIMVPLSDTLTFLDIIKTEKIPSIVVIANKLGCINHALLTIQTLLQNNIQILGLVFNTPQLATTKTARIIQKDNRDTIIKRHEILINNQYKTIKSKSLKIDSLKKNRKYLIIFGSIIGLLTQLLF